VDMAFRLVVHWTTAVPAEAAAFDEPEAALCFAAIQLVKLAERGRKVGIWEFRVLEFAPRSPHFKTSLSLQAQNV
jgi:hypothetical protein